MTSTEPATPDAAVAASPKKRPSPLLPVLAIVLALVGGFLIGYSFLTGVASQFDPSGTRSSLYIALFFVGLGIVIVGIVFALVGIVRRAHRGVSLVALVLSMLPSFVVLVVAALLFL
jgi:hypothetical protein